MKSSFNVVATKYQNPNEINLFEILMKQLNSSKTRTCYVKSVHAHAGFVNYNSLITGKIKKVEIADLQILNFNRARNELRMCFLQAKYKRSRYRNFISFPGDNYQLELMTLRCQIMDKYNNGFPQDILSFTSYQTITSYGLFFIDRSGEIEFLFTLPDHLHPSNRTKRTTTLLFSGKCFCPNVNCRMGVNVNETISICSMDGFEQQLQIGNIGAPVAHHTRYVSSLLGSMYRRTNQSFIREFSSVAHIPIDDSSSSVNNIDTFLVISEGGVDG